MIENKKHPMLLPPDWIFKGQIDFEYLQYKLMAFLSKIEKSINEKKVYPALSELSLHLGNIMTMKASNRIMYIDKDYLLASDEIHLEELKYMPVPNMSKEDMLEYHKVIRFSSEKIEFYFQATLALWQVIYNFVNFDLITKDSDIESDIGFICVEHENVRHVWQYNLFKSYSRLDVKPIKSIYDSSVDLIESIKKTTRRKNIDNLPVFFVHPVQDIPLEESVLPIAKRRIFAHIKNSTKPTKLKLIKIEI
jgi:hypothetical protein